MKQEKDTITVLKTNMQSGHGIFFVRDLMKGEGVIGMGVTGKKQVKYLHRERYMLLLP